MRRLLLLCVLLAVGSASAPTGLNYTVGLSVLNETSGFSTANSPIWGWSLTNLNSAFIAGSQYYTLLDNYNGPKALVSFDVSTGAINTMNTTLDLHAVSYDPTSGSVLVVQQDWVNGAIQVGVLNSNGTVKPEATFPGFTFVDATNAIDPATGLLYLVGQDIDGNLTLFGVTFSGAVKVNASLMLEGIDSIVSLVVCNSQIYGLGAQSFPNASIEVVSVSKTGVVNQLNILAGTGLEVYLGLTAANPGSNLLYFGTALNYSGSPMISVVNVKTNALASDEAIQGMVTAAWAYSQ